MRRVVISWFVVVALILAGILGGAGLFRSTQAAVAQSATPTVTTARGPEHLLPSQLQFLRSMTPQERFDHFTGGQLTWVNPQGKQVVLNIIPGKVTAVTSNTLTIQPNGTTTTRTFNVVSSTFVRGTARRGSLSAFATGDRVIVTTIDNTNDATSITGWEFARAGRYPYRSPRGMMPMPGGAATTATPTTTPTTPTATPTP